MVILCFKCRRMAANEGYMSFLWRWKSRMGNNSIFVQKIGFWLALLLHYRSGRSYGPIKPETLLLKTFNKLKKKKKMLLVPVKNEEGLFQV